MNDLAEKALHGLDVARRQVAARPMSGFAVLGLALSCAVVAAGGRVNAGRSTRPLTRWLGLQDAHGAQPDDWAPGAAMLAALAALVLLWLAVVRYVEGHDQPQSRVWVVAGAWALPFAAGPPLMGTSVQSYAAFGLLQRSGLNPYEFGPNRLSGERVVAAVEPAARGTPSAAGSLGTLLQHLAVSVSSGNALGAVLILRGVALVAAIFIGRLAADIAGLGPARSRALTLTVLNPLLLLYLVSAARLEAVMLAFVLAAIAAANQRRWLAAVALTCVAGSVLGEAFLLLPVVLTVHWLGRRTIPTWLLLGRDLLVAAATTAAAGLVVRHGFGWLWTVDDQFAAHTPFSVTTAIAKLFTPVVRGASYDDLAAGARITAVTALVCVLAYLIGTARRRALERTAGCALLALALLSPVLNPWYLLWGTICLAPTANGARRVAVLALCAAGCFITPPGFTPTTSNVITGVALALVAVAVFAWGRLGWTSDRPVPVSAGT
jgi:hypothetical protein